MGSDPQTTDNSLEALWREYNSKVYQAAGLVETKNPSDLRKALDIFRDLLNRPLPVLDQVVTLANMATIHEQLQQMTDALECYDRAIALESRHNRFFALERKAVFLGSLKRNHDSIALYSQLLSRGDLVLADRKRIEDSIRKLQ